MSIKSNRSMMAAALATGMLAPAALGQTLEQRIERVTKELEEKRDNLHVPGMAVAVVHDGKVVLSHGFGVSDVDAKTPVTEETAFAIGSTTKAMTATGIGILVDAGVMSWDDPVAKHLPGYKLTDPQANEQVTIRDLLCHRTGLASMTMLWYGNDVTAAEVLERSYNAQLLHPFREKWNYSNISFLAAGLASAHAAKADSWPAFMQERLLGPLGISDANFTIDPVHPNMSKGYRWDDDLNSLELMDYRSVDPVAPAGAINANIKEMARWVALQLGRGELDGQRLISEANLEETWKPHVNVGPDSEYGLGWFVGRWREHTMIHHAGGIDGFAAEVSLLPDQQVGFVLLSNQFTAPIGVAARDVVFDGMLGTWDEESETLATTEDYSPYLGAYIGTFAQFKDATFEVLVQNGNLAIDVPGQIVFELKPPDERGIRQFALTDQIKVQFNRGDKSEAHSFTIYQAGMEFEVMREGAVVAAEFDLESVQPHLGKYHAKSLATDVTVLLQNNRLAVDVPGQMVYELHPPDEDDNWRFRVTDTISVRFNSSHDGQTESMTFTQNGVKELMERVDQNDAMAAQGDVLPTVDELVERMFDAQGGDGSLWQPTLLSGTIQFDHMGVQGRSEVLVVDAKRYRQTVDLGRFGNAETLLDGARGWAGGTFMDRREIHGDALVGMQLEHPAVWTTDWRKSFDSMKVSGVESFDGTECYVVEVTTPETGTMTIHVSKDTLLPVARQLMQISPLGMRFPVTYRFYDYRPVRGILFPFNIHTENDINGRARIQFDSVELDVDIPDVFAAQAKDAA